jgi:hypothetical protein
MTEKQSNRYSEKSSTRGGVREGSGRPKGSTHKITAKDLLEQCEKIVGKPFAVSLLEGYRDSILDGDTKTRVTYEKIILDKTAATMLDVEVEEVGDVANSKQTAFLQALNSLNNINKTKDDKDASD